MSQCLMIEQMDKHTNECKKTQGNTRKQKLLKENTEKHKEMHGNAREII